MISRLAILHKRRRPGLRICTGVKLLRRERLTPSHPQRRIEVASPRPAQVDEACARLHLPRLTTAQRHRIKVRRPPSCFQPTMSITVEYLFNSALAFDSLVDLLNDKLGLCFAPYNGDSADQYCRLLGMELSLHSCHGLVNDGECRFEDYAYQIETRTPVCDGDLRVVQVELMAMLAYTMHRRLNVLSGLLTFDVQCALARYRTTETGWYDELSCSPVTFPQHLVTIRDRITRAGWEA
ncbi:hypothetical protein KOR34_40110 [Posidoniimonas corsicana]|uniref:Uncharacterized protein n=1 Tax=Posidoniimonas corsicana TaxID=1938618 RepID=A0A5C5V2T3_9BACT|nr:hypothetical protein KOR34_40110 [Posidoniimonas corsicana]